MTDKYAPPDKAIDIGGDHKIVYAEYQGEVVGIQDWHRKKDGSWCCGWVPFKGAAWEQSFSKGPGIQSWDVVQREPLTLTPSLLCRACGDHCWITNGRWVPA